MSDEATKTTGFLARFTVLRSAPRELWIIFGAKLLAILAYGIMNPLLTLWLSRDLGFGDESAGDLIACWAAMMTFATVAVGSLVDVIGIRKALLIGLGACIGARIVMACVTAPWVVLPLGLLPVALGEAMLTPVMVAAVTRYTTTAQRSIAFSIVYALMNAGFGIAFWILDYFRDKARMGEHGSITLLGLEFSTYRTLFLVSLLFTVAVLVIVYLFLRDGVEVTDKGVKIVPVPRAAEATTVGETLLRTLRDASKVFSSLWRRPAFYKFLLFLSLVVAVRMLFIHNYYTYPKFGTRELGEGAPIMQLLAINSFMIVVLVPIVGALTQRIRAYPLVVFGSCVSALSVFVMAMPPEWFRPLADGFLGDLIARRWLGVEGAVHPYYVMIAIYIVFLSIGEAFWSPRLYEYTAAVAPKGQEASYMSMSYLPLFVSKLIIGMLSGRLLAAYCPEEGPRDSQTLWLIIALITLITPIGLCVCKRFIHIKEAGREE